MTFTPDFCSANIRIDTESDILFGSDQMNVSNPLRFPTVEIPLRDMSGLYEIADNMRMALGHLPMMPHAVDDEDECYEADEESYDADGWYNFYVGIYRLPDGDHLEHCIRFTVDSYASDDGDEYMISLDEEEQKTVFACLDENASERLNTSCAALLDMAQAEMEEE